MNKNLLFVVFFFVLSSFATASAQIGGSPFYWTETLGGNTVASMPNLQFVFGNSSIAHNVITNTSVVNNNVAPNAWAAIAFYPYNTTTGFNLTSGGKLTLSNFSLTASGGTGTTLTWYVREAGTLGGCNGTTLATGTAKYFSTNYSAAASVVNVFMEATKQYCIAFTDTSTAGVFKTNVATNNMGCAEFSADGAGWGTGADCFKTLPMFLNFTEFVPVRSPLLTINTSNQNVSFVAYRNASYQQSINNITRYPATQTYGCFKTYAKFNTTNPAQYSMIGARNTPENGGIGFMRFDGGLTANQFNCLPTTGAPITLPADISTQYHYYEVCSSPTATTCYFDNQPVYISTADNLGLEHGYIESASGNTKIEILSEVYNENTLPSGASVSLWSNGSGTYSWIGITSDASNKLLSSAYRSENYSSTYIADGFFYPNQAGPKMYFEFKFNSPSNYNFSDCALYTPTTNFGVGDFITAFANNQMIYNRSNGGNTTVVNLTSIIGSVNTLSLNFTASTPNPAIAYSRLFDSSLMLNCTLSNSSTLNLPVLVNGVNNLSATTSNGSNNYSVIVSPVDNITQSFSETNFTAFEFQNASASLAITNATWGGAWDSIFVGGTQRQSGVAFNVSSVPVGAFNRTDATVAQFSSNYFSSFNLSETPLVVYTARSALTNCSFLSNTVGINFSTVWEENSTPVFGTQAGTFDFVVVNGNDPTVYNYSSSVSGFSWPLCLYPSSVQLLVNSTQSYYNSSSQLRYSFLLNASITNSSNSVNLMVPDANAAYVSVVVKDSLGNTVPDRYVSFQRQFLASGQYLEVARGLTSATGQFSVWLRPDVLYNVIVYDASGDVVASFFQQSISSPLTIWLPATTSNLAYLTDGKTSWVCSLTNSSANCTFIDTSGVSLNASLVLMKHGILSETELCRSSLTTSSGSLYCNASGWSYQNKYSYAFFIEHGDPIWNSLESGFLPRIEVPTFGLDGLLWVLFMFITMGLLGSWKAEVALGYGALVLIFSLWIGLLPATAAYGAVLGFVVVILIAIGKFNG